MSELSAARTIDVSELSAARTIDVSELSAARTIDMPELFAEHTIESAPPGARRSMTATRDRLGYLPAPVARMATSPQLLDGFLRLSAHGHTRQNALEVVLGIGTYTMSTLANRPTRAPLDDQLAAFNWQDRRAARDIVRHGP